MGEGGRAAERRGRGRTRRLVPAALREDGRRVGQRLTRRSAPDTSNGREGVSRPLPARSTSRGFRHPCGDPNLAPGPRLDTEEHRLVEALGADGRMGFSRLASRTHTSAATAQRRLHRLRLTGGAENATLVDRCQVGLDVQAVFFIQSDDGRRQPVEPGPCRAGRGPDRTPTRMRGHFW
ncbi:AsnC family transcriptional regulator [Streptomyces sp. NPDC048370]|uniref:AsnC family transcriptional regulator n=1 Tax=Streptomyces sp. NPDC048370 TaxID=3365540 RepID=UPI003714E9D4